MPTLPLYAQTLTAGEPEAWHRVTAPGGYEVWRFVAHDAGRDLWLMAALSWGTTFQAAYLRRYERYRCWPTRVTPPVPKENCCASFAVYEGGALLARFDVPVNGDEFAVSRGQSGVSAGANRLLVDPDGKLHLNLRGMTWQNTWRGPQVVQERTVTARLVFAPVPVASLREIELLEGEGPIHRWAIGRPVCAVSGEISIFQESGTPRTLEFTGRGCHDHIWGIRPLAWDFAGGICGYVLDEGRTFCFQHLVAGRSATSSRIVGVDASGVRDHAVAAETLYSQEYPDEIRFGDLLSLDEPRIIGHTMFDTRLTYVAKWADRTGVAFCEIVNWKKLRRPAPWRLGPALPG